MVEQNSVARQHGLTFHRTAPEIRASVERGDLVKLTGNLHYSVADFVSFPYLEPAAHLFVERVAAQYYSACGQQLVVTSATRPANSQPANSHHLSVHPTGIAVDLRVSDRASCRSWLESALLGMESRGLINGIRERHPPHYHVAVYPGAYMAFVKERVAEEERAAAAAAREATAVQAALGGLRAHGTEIASALLPDEAVETEEAPARSGRLLLAAALALLVMIPARIRTRLQGGDR